MFCTAFRAARWKVYWKRNTAVQDTNFKSAGWCWASLVIHSHSASVCFCVYVCVSLSTPSPTTLVFHVSHSIPSKTAGQGYTATKEKQKFSCCLKKNQNSGYHSFIQMLPVSIQMLSPTEHSCKKQSFDFPFVFTNPSSFSTQRLLPIPFKS